MSGGVAIARLEHHGEELLLVGATMVALALEQFGGMGADPMG